MSQNLMSNHMPTLAKQANFPNSRKKLIEAVAQYARPDRRKAAWQISNTFLPYFGLWALMIFSVLQGYSYWITLLLAVPSAGFLVRIFIFFHDSCHGAFFTSRWANRIIGYITGIMTFTSFEDWQRTHIIHHGTSGDLDRRGTGGDIWTMTVEEYLHASKLKRFMYRLYRNPLVLFTVIPIVLFLIVQRFPSLGAGKRERCGVLFTNLAIVTVIVLMSMTLGFVNYLLIQLPVLFIAASTGMWLFYVQHQYEGVYWARHENWDLTKAGLEGSSYYKLPKIMQWMAGNIGLHHIHHVRANIPNYNLQRCYNEVSAMQRVKPLTIRQSIGCTWLKLWDEKQQKLVGFRALKQLLQPPCAV
jgi:omega-6 fatty acid desaturase (delta-12 desaturase)